MKLSTLFLIAAVGAVSIGVVGEKVTLLGQPSLLGRIGVNMNVRSSLALDASPLMVPITDPITKITLTDVNRNPLILSVELGENVVSGLVGIEAHRKFVNVVCVASLAGSDPVAGVTHGDGFGLGWQNVQAVPAAAGGSKSNPTPCPPLGTSD